MRLCLLPLGGNRFELYAELPDETPAAVTPNAGLIRRIVNLTAVKWREMVAAANDNISHRRDGGWLARWCDRLICHLAESVAGQQAFWALARHDHATLRYPASIDETAAREVLLRVLREARRLHGRWLVFDAVLFVPSLVLTLIPFPNIPAYYLAVRIVTHFQSWRAAGRAPALVWTLHADADLAELATLVDVPPAVREPRVRAIAERLDLQRLPAFFERMAA
ncbi:MAG: hypothetical protein LBQ09_08185 [Acidobacteriaceae bacterium]|jgi:NADH:ubiquinone oxidoreductase subunit E|nr:hypothetical protein [Acidobacteriaceae bacterium]